MEKKWFAECLKIVKFTVKVFKREWKVAQDNSNNTSAEGTATTNQPCRQSDVIDDYWKREHSSFYSVFLFGRDRSLSLRVSVCNFDCMHFISRCFWFAFYSRESNPISPQDVSPVPQKRWKLRRTVKNCHEIIWQMVSIKSISRTLAIFFFSLLHIWCSFNIVCKCTCTSSNYVPIEDETTTTKK